MHHAAIAGCNAGPLMHGAFEHFRPADEIADMPIGQRDLAAERRGVEHPDPAALDQPDTVMLPPWLNSVWPRLSTFRRPCFSTSSRSRWLSLSINAGGPPIHCWFSVSSSEEPPAGRTVAGTVPRTTLAAACNIICLRNVQTVLKRSNVRARFTPLSSPGLTGRSSIPETSMGYREAAAYWIPHLPPTLQASAPLGLNPGEALA